MSYFNTNDESGQTLADSETQTAHQNDVVLAVFQNDPQSMFAPHDISVLVNNRWPLTSIRRAITTLTGMGLLEKTDHKRVGTFGKQVHTWRLRPQ